MRLADLRHDRGRGLVEWAAWGRTLDARRRIDVALHDLTAWRAACERPVVSVSGGKDSTLLLLLARRVDAGIVAVRGDPPNGLSDRAGHVAQLAQAAGGPWRVVPYPWEVEAVLAGEARYPAGLKVRRLRADHADHGTDGVAMGLRAAESRPRAAWLRRAGTRYRWADGTRVCCPLAWWSAEQVVGALLALDVLPLCPVYYRTALMPSRGIEAIRDGTWWPHSRAQTEEGSSWLRYHYPEHVAEVDRAMCLPVRDDEVWVLSGPPPAVRYTPLAQAAGSHAPARGAGVARSPLAGAEETP